MSIELLARPEILGLKAYETARQEPGLVRLNANEAPWSCDGADGDGLNRYPEIRPVRLHARLASHYRVSPEMLLATRGSSEAIDLLLRAFCRAGSDEVVICPPTFAMYRVYAEIQGARVIEAPLATEEFALDPAAVLERCTPRTKVVFVCSPNNPTGGIAPLACVRTLAEGRAGQSLIVVDEAYAEFSDAPSAVGLLPEHENVVVLRTFSKAQSLAGARCGAVLASAGVIRLLGRILAPYALATPVVDCVLDALKPGNLARARETQRVVLAERRRLFDALPESEDVLRVWPSHGNFLLARFTDAERVDARLHDAGILVRRFPRENSLEDCARISVGKPRENDLLLAALGVPVPEHA